MSEQCSECGLGISASLCALAKDESNEHALSKAEQWKLVLEEILECANDHEQAQLQPLLITVQNKIIHLTHRCQKREALAV
jgi:hypothetical protein